MRELTDRARANQHKQERREETYKNKRIHLAKGREGTRKVSERPEHRLGGGEWKLPPQKEDIVARKLMGGQDGRGVQRVLKDEAMDPAHEEKYAGHPILRLFTRPAELENGTYIRMAKEDVAHMNAASGKKLTYDTLQGGTQRLSETTYGVWQGPELAEILRDKRKKATALQKRIGITLDQRDKARAVEQGVLNGRLGDSATAAGAELFAIFAILRKVQAKQEMGHYGDEKARILIMSDCLSGLRRIEKVWRGRRNRYRKLQNGA
eukprot:1980950-Pleurochrysis_carterae.AAC.1